MAEAEYDNPLAAEVMAEKANAYFTTVRRMEAAVLELKAFDVGIAREVGERERKRMRDELVMKAAEQVLFFMIQREAMRLPYYEEIFTDFEIPEEVRKEMGRCQT